MISINPTYFPHIWEAFIHNLERSDRLCLRLVSVSVKNLVDKSICGDELNLRSNKPAAADFQLLSPQRLPFFSPWSTEDSRIQLYAVRRARVIAVDLPYSDHVRRLLAAAMEPATTLDVRHPGGDSLYGLQPLPPCNTIQVKMRIPDLCQCTEGSSWVHSAQSVTLDVRVVEDLPENQRIPCAILKNAIQPSVEALTLHIRAYEEEVVAVAQALVGPGRANTLANLSNIQVMLKVDPIEGADQEELTSKLVHALVEQGFSAARISVDVDLGPSPSTIPFAQFVSADDDNYDFDLEPPWW